MISLVISLVIFVRREPEFEQHGAHLRLLLREMIAQCGAGDQHGRPVMLFEFTRP